MTLYSLFYRFYSYVVFVLDEGVDEEVQDGFKVTITFL